MKKLLLLFLFLTGSQLTYGSHAVGAEMTYQSLGEDTFRITYTFYRDCTGIPPPGAIPLIIVPSGGVTYTQSIYPLPNSPTQLNINCPTSLSTCNGGVNTGIQVWVYQGIVVLNSDTTFMIYHSESARNSSITTITGAGSDDLFVYVVIDNSQHVINSSPQFNREPPVLLCLNRLTNIPSFVSDTDGDSLVFQMITPRTGPNPFDTVMFISPNSTTQPFVSQPPVSFNPFIGEISLVPQTSAQVSIVALLISEYRNGILLGQVERDWQMTIINCNDHLPLLSGLNGTNISVANVCIGQTNCFFISSKDADSLQTTSMFWDSSITNATVTFSLGHRDSMLICWTPTFVDTANNPHCFFVSATDDNCPYPNRMHYKYCLYVRDSSNCSLISVEEINYPKESFQIYPQPASEHVNFKFMENTNGHLLRIIDLMGREIKSYRITDEALDVEINDMPPAVYSALLTDSNRRLISCKRLLILK